MGKKKAIKSPEVLWGLFEKYVEATKSNPIKIKDWVGKDAKPITRERERPLTLVGFYNYVAREGIITRMSDYFSNRGGRYEKYVPICSRVREEIRQDQIEGGMGGIYNASITQRLNDLIDKRETNLKGGINIPTVPDIGNRGNKKKGK